MYNDEINLSESDHRVPKILLCMCIYFYETVTKDNCLL